MKAIKISTPNFLIVGGGIIGLSSALELARRGASVTVLERGACGSESSWAGGGILSPLLPWNYPAAVTNLTQLSCQIYAEWAGHIAGISGLDPEYRRSGMLVLPEFDSGRAMNWGRSHQARIELVQKRDRLPEVVGDGEALWLPDVAQVRNPRLIKALRLTLERMGVRILEHVEVAGIVAGGGRLVRLDTSVGPFEADQYVVAAGAWSKKLLGEQGVQVDIKPIRGQMLLYRAQPGLLRHIVLQNGFYLIPRDDGHILAGSTLEDAGFDKSTSEEVRSGLHANAISLLPQLAQAELVKHWAGLRPGSPGNIPVIACHPKIENLYLNSGHFRYGVTMAPASARILANRIFRREQPFDVSPYHWPEIKKH
ncbi:MAG: glycine oxidase ThiO [Betaproteobacteria bacterium]|nr:glycine oxidase ThiO [Betaproteobacteria bacterium]